MSCVGVIVVVIVIVIAVVVVVVVACKPGSRRGEPEAQVEGVGRRRRLTRVRRE